MDVLDGLKYIICLLVGLVLLYVVSRIVFAAFFRSRREHIADLMRTTRTPLKPRGGDANDDR